MVSWFRDFRVSGFRVQGFGFDGFRLWGLRVSAQPNPEDV